MRPILVLIACLWSMISRADELPRELLLKCEGKITSYFTGTAPSTRDMDITIRLKDGVMGDTDGNHMDMRCKLEGGKIQCASTRIVELDIMKLGLKGSEKRDLEAYVVRQTGEYKLKLETTSYNGNRGTGAKTGELTHYRNGVCRPVGGPVF